MGKALRQAVALALDRAGDAVLKIVVRAGVILRGVIRAAGGQVVVRLAESVEALPVRAAQRPRHAEDEGSLVNVALAQPQEFGRGEAAAQHARAVRPIRCPTRAQSSMVRYAEFSFRIRHSVNVYPKVAGITPVCRDE